MKKYQLKWVAMVMLTIASMDLFAQSNEQRYQRLISEKRKLETSNASLQEERRSQIESQISTQISKGVDKAESQIMNSKPEDGAISQLKTNVEKLQIVNDPDATPEQLKEASEFVITEGKDFEVTEDGDVRLTSYHGFEIKTAEFSNAIEEYNDNWDSFQRITKECVNLNKEYVKMDSNKAFYGQRAVDEKKRQLDNKIAEQKAINDKAMVISKKASDMAVVILSSTTDPNLIEEVNKYVNDLEKYNRVSDDYRNLMDHLKDCTDCGQQ